MQIRLFTGKGGVGKTTIAAATGIKAALEGYKTLVMSIDPAHSLSDSFDIELGPEPVQIMENLYAQELNVYYSMKKYWESLRKIIFEMLRWQGLDRIEAEELSALPGMEEASAFLWLEKYYSEDEFDFVVIDSAPTGETLTMLSLPQMTKWWTSKLFALPKFAARTMGMAINATFGIPFTKSMDELEFLIEKINSINSVLMDSEKTAVRIVLNPEKMVIEEARRAYTYLEMYGFNVDSVLINKIIPDGEGGDFFKNYIKSQNTYINIIKKDFYPLKVFELSHSGEEIFGFERIKEFASKIYENDSPSNIYSKHKFFNIKEFSNGYLMETPIPFGDDSVILVLKKGSCVIIELADKRKHIYLPRFLQYYELGNHYFKDGMLNMEFVKD